VEQNDKKAYYHFEEKKSAKEHQGSEEADKGMAKEPTEE
jgi:hypothetical protein